MNIVRFFVQFKSSIYTRLQYIYGGSINSTQTYYATISSLSRDTIYSISVRMDVRFTACIYSYYYVTGTFSNPITIKTNSTGKQWGHSKGMPQSMLPLQHFSYHLIFVTILINSTLYISFYHCSNNNYYAYLKQNCLRLSAHIN